MPYDLIIGRNEADKKDFKKRGLAYIGKSYVKMGQYSSLSNPIFLDVARTHVMLISGKRGSGKCLHGDTLISLGDGSQISIKDLAENKENVMSLNENLKIGSARRSEFFSREVTKLLKLKLRSGKEIKLTPEHPLLTVKGWKPVQDLAVGSRIATPRKIEAFGKNSLPEYEIKLLSYLLAEGHTKKIVLFANSDDKIVEDFESSLKEFDPSLKLVKEKENHYRITDPCWKTKVLSHDKQRNSRGQFLKGSKNIVKKRSIRKLIEREEMFGLLAIEKYISKNLMNLNKESLSLFLNRLFSCDGSLYKANNYWEGSYSSSSKKLIRQVHSLLLKFGILSRIRDKRIVHKGKEFKSYEVVINSENLVKFIEQIGFFGDKAKKEFIAKQEILAKKRNTNIDTIPQEIWENFKPSSWVKIGKALNYKHPKSARERIRYAPSRNTLLSVAEVEQNQELQLLAQSDIFWDEVSSVEEINGKFTVYDISVPKNHNFVANDIIVHNSYTMGSIAESLSDLNKEESGNIASLIFDTMGIYWTMKFKNEKDKTLLKEWGLKSKNVPVKVFAPSGHFKKLREEGVAVDKEFAIKVSELDATDWLGVFDLEFTDPVGVAIERAIASLKENKKTYSFSDIFDALNASGES